MKLPVVVCTPWIPTGCRWRERAKHHTARYWTSLGLSVIYGEDQSRPVNRAAARNRAAERADAEVLFFADADMWVERLQVIEACERAAETGGMVLAYTDHTRLSRWSTEKVYAGSQTLIGQTIQHCCSGCFAIPRLTYEALGGHDERFRGWGGEDRAFMFAAMTLASVERIGGTSYHLWHPRGIDQGRTTAERRAGLALAERYKLAAGVTDRSGIIRATRGAVRDPVAMRSLMAEDGGPLHHASLSI